MGWTTADAPTTAELSACVQCGLCLPYCPTFRLTGKETASPRGRLMAMSAVAAGIAPVDATFEEIMGFCLQCRACEAVCPSLVPFGRAMEGARAELTAQRPTRRRRLRHTVLGRALAAPRLMAIGTYLLALAQRGRLTGLAPGRLRSGLDGLRPLPLRMPSVRGAEYPPVGEQVGTAALLAGCVMEPWFGAVHHATIEVLRRAGYRVTVPPDQRCCGALAAHDGAAGEARRLAALNLAALGRGDIVVADAAGCGAHLKDYHHWAPRGRDVATRVRDVTELVADGLAEGRLPTVAATGSRVAVQDPCHLRHAQRITDAPRRVLAGAGYEVIEIDPDGLCCGAAGIYGLLHPQASAELGRQKAAQVQAAGTTVVASANPGCEIQLRSHLGRDYRIAHPVELYWEALDGAEHRGLPPTAA